MKEFADDNMNPYENGRVETTEAGEIARCEQYLLFSQCFQKIFAADE